MSRLVLSLPQTLLGMLIPSPAIKRRMPLRTARPPRPGRPAELARVTAAATAIFRATRPGAMGRDYPLLFGTHNAARLWIVEEDGAVLAHAGYCLATAVAHGQQSRAA